MSVADLSADLQEALKELEALITSPILGRDPSGSQLARVRFLVARAARNVKSMGLHEPTDLSPMSVDAVMPYLQSLDFGTELGRNVYITHLVAPLPIDRDRLALEFLYAEAFRRNVLDAVLATINEGRIDVGWMTEGGFDWQRGEGWFEFRNAVRRGPPWQGIRIYQSGLIAFRERWANRAAYPSTRFEGFAEATLSFSNRILTTFPTSIYHVALSSQLANASGVNLGVPGMFGLSSTFDMLAAKQSEDDFYVPQRPQVIRRERLSSESKALATVALKALESRFVRLDSDQ